MRACSRLVFYLLLLFPCGTSKRENPWDLPEQLQTPRPRRKKVSDGIICALFPHYSSSGSVASTVRLCTRVSLVLAAVGLGGVATRATAALGWFWLAGAMQGRGEMARKYLVPTFTLLFMCLEGQAELSLDGLLTQWWSDYPFSPAVAGIFASEIGSSLSFYYLSWSLLGSVSAKLRRNPAWGGTLRDILQRRMEPARVPRLKRILCASPLLCVVLGYSTLVVETAVFAGNFYEPAKAVGLLLMLSMHVGITAVMPPVFAHQMLSYLLMVDWQHLFGYGTPGNLVLSLIHI
eukprot:TRINITY_DN39923_c0_g1_i1.p1 TRINITY_DN39923_c0_g1~~TRINITY_DN39923_c0_g1_i1.p1  ORF type:complete len:291 (+),score=47.48 TRINITY_DN39923_c0_g1_i1:39-911(+)